MGNGSCDPFPARRQPQPFVLDQKGVTAERPFGLDVVVCRLLGNWNTFAIDGAIPEAELRRMIDDSYNLVVKGLNKSERDMLA